MFNPFKKKDEGFSLDDYSLPSLNNSINKNEINNDNVSDLSDEQLINQTPKFEENSFSTPAFNNSQYQNNFQENNNNNNNNNNDLTKAKLETIETRVSLIDVRMSSIEQKLEMIYQMLSLEISDETKKKLKIQSMMDNIKEK